MQWPWTRRWLWNLKETGEFDFVMIYDEGKYFVLAHMHDQFWYPLETQGKFKGVAWTIRHGKSNKGRGPPWVPE